MLIACETCGNQFDRKPSQIKDHNFCSRKCLGSANGMRSRKNHQMTCDYCGKEFIQKNRHASRNKRFYCSRECGWADKVKRIVVLCEWCGQPFEKKRSDVARSNHNLCDRGCYQDFINFVKAGAPNQYVAGKIIYRTLAEMKIGRALTDEEEVHHIDGNHTNNALENLAVVSRAEHMSIHAAEKRRDANGRFADKG